MHQITKTNTAVINTKLVEALENYINKTESVAYRKLTRITWSGPITC